MDYQHQQEPLLSPSTNSSNDSNKNAILFVVALAIFTDMAIYGVIIPILPEVAKQGSQSLLFASYACALLVMTPVFGVLSDMLGDRKGPMLVGQVGMLLATVLFILADGYWWLVLARILQGVSAAATWVVGLALLNETFSASEMGRAIGLVSSVNLAGFLVGPLIGGLAQQWSGSVKVPFVGCALLAALDLVVRAMIRIPAGTEREESGRSSGWSFNQLIGRIASERAWYLIVVLVVGASTISLLEASMAEHLHAKFGLSAMQISLMFLGLLIPGMAFSMVFGRLSGKINCKIMMSIGLLFHGISLPFLAFSQSVSQFLAALVFFSVTEALMLTPVIPELAFLAERANNFNYAQLYALYNLCYSAGMMLGPVVGSVLGGGDFERASLWFCFGIYCFAPVLVKKYCFLGEAEVNSVFLQ
jgi:DHA1 family solute carrier family 18 vesicular amine transporter 1/2